MILAAVLPPTRQCMANVQQMRAAGLTRHLQARAVKGGDIVPVAPRVFSTSELPERGEHLLTDGQLDIGYLAEIRAVTLSIRCVAARRTAAFLWQLDMLVEPTEIELDVPEGRKKCPLGLDVVRRRELSTVTRRWCAFEPIRVTSAVQTVVDCALHLPVLEAVVIADSALRRKVVTRRQLVEASQALRGVPGRSLLKKVITLSDAKSGSVLESVCRVILLLAGVERPESQWTVLDGQAFVGRVDFCWPALRLIVECDGRRWHDPADARNSDRVRDNICEKLSWRVLRFTWAEVVHDPEYVVAMVRACLRGWLAA